MQQQIRDWLGERGLAHYADAFAAQNVDLAILPDLTDQDLKDLGVLLGDRRKILAWAASLRGSSGGGAAAPQPQSNLGERRQVTVLFSDIVDSTVLSRSIDPEDLRALIRAYQDAVTKTVGRLDGLVAGFRGDGVLVYFGYPQAHEDDAERAVRAGLELIAAVRVLPSATSLKIRVGIATGLVVVGDLIRSGDTQERDILGETPNLAARVLALAEPDTVVIADGTRRLLGDLYEFTDLGLKSIKGLATPVRTWSVLQPLAVESRYEALHSAGVTELTGRDDELSLLKKRWSKAKCGDGQVVLISGEPGIGKSRLTVALMEEIAAEPHARLRYFCSPQHTDSAFYPVIGHIERAANFAHDDGADAKLDKLEKLLTANAVNAAGKALIAGLLSLPTDRYPALDYDAAQRRAKTMEALNGQVVTLCRRGPVLMILEDAHWIDPTSQEAFGRTVERLKGLRVLLVITYRPEFDAPWVGDAHVTTLTLNRLGDAESSQIVGNMIGNKSIPGDVIADIVDRSDGIPLFLEEMTKAVLEAESETAARKTVSSVPSQSHAVPASLHASLMSRLDRLGAAKGIAHVGAAIGRSFTYTLLAAVANDDPDTLRIHLDRLVASGLLFRQGQPPDATYLFKHALIRDAAYSMLLREPRRALHARILEALETKFADIAEAQPELLAHHATEAAQTEKAAQLWGEAGKRSFERSALREAKSQLSCALDQIETLPDSPSLRRIEIDVLLALAHTNMHLVGYAAKETEDAYQNARTAVKRAESVGDVIDDPLVKFAVLYGLWVNTFVAYNRDAMHRLAMEFFSLAERDGTSGPLMLAHRLMACTHMYAGELDEARRLFERTIALYDPIEHRKLTVRFGQDARVMALAYGSEVTWMLGYPEAAARNARQAVSEARELGQAPSLMFALSHLLLLESWIGWTEASTDLLAEFTALTDAKESLYWKSMALIHNAGEDVDLLRKGIDAYRQTDATLLITSPMSKLALALGRLGEFAAANRLMTHAAELLASNREAAIVGSELRRRKGELALLRPMPDIAAAEAEFEAALSIAREQNAKSWELLAALSLARLWRDQGKRREAYDLLFPLYNWFTEGFEWTYMKQAKSLLDELKSSID